ncbi:MAG: arylsulfotransferase family protein, partial [Albidovulum sp.]
MPKDLDRKVFIGASALLLTGAIFAAGYYSAVSRNIVYRGVKKITTTVDTIRSDWQNLLPGGEPVHFLQPARLPGDGVTINTRPDDGKLIMIAGYFDDDNQVRLIRRDGTVVAKWPVRMLDLFPDLSFTRLPPATNHNIDIHGALINPDGSLVFNFDYGGTTKLSRCGDVLWTLPAETHHSVERSEKGGYWIPTRGYIDPPDYGVFYPLTHPTKKVGFFLYDKIAKVSEDGKILSEKSVPEILFDNGLAPVLTAIGSSYTHSSTPTAELTHVNKIAELPAAYAAQFPQFEAGDLMLSLRTHNLIFVVDPDTWKVKWHSTGPWVRQHDPEFAPDGTILVFNNNAYRLSLTEDSVADLSAPR